ncbi:N-acetyltransferase [Shewanella algicola]|uniref:GNAT family N-acetyltransferase n=1 Tax=Shewanella algicola TaxID=640633 RepID=A0A9X2CBT5_9GAMM|nr:GNAT family N-acetyltransferase [Shewanella algicola]MCL1105203.1 GNAT family N-acetyltransferase [Shewanella algicola]GGP49345.1 N-acetyltransferase [Shewanella algicola]
MTYQFVEGTVEDIVAVLALVPEFDNSITATTIAERLAGKSALILVAKYDTAPIGFKVGYSLNHDEFYSWLGGVVPLHREMKVASQLRQLQESWAVAQGFKAIKVKSMNQFPNMLHMLIASGYHICGYDNNGATTNSKIAFIKNITQT